MHHRVGQLLLVYHVGRGCSLATPSNKKRATYIQVTQLPSPYSSHAGRPPRSSMLPNCGGGCLPKGAAAVFPVDGDAPLPSGGSADEWTSSYSDASCSLVFSLSRRGAISSNRFPAGRTTERLSGWGLAFRQPKEHFRPRHPCQEPLSPRGIDHSSWSHPQALVVDATREREGESRVVSFLCSCCEFTC